MLRAESSVVNFGRFPDPASRSCRRRGHARHVSPGPFFRSSVWARSARPYAMR